MFQETVKEEFKQAPEAGGCARGDRRDRGRMADRAVLRDDQSKNVYSQEKVEWIEEPVDRQIKQGTVDEVRFTAKLSAKGKKAKWYMRNQVK